MTTVIGAKPIASIEELRIHLQFAIGLELATIPVYLSALYSIPDGTNTAASRVIQSVAIEEMLHMALAANVLNAIGGTPSTSPVDDVPIAGTTSDPIPSFPGHPAFLPGLELHLRRFSIDALDLFLKIEHPQRGTKNPATGYGSIGAFYDAILRALRSKKICPDSVFETAAKKRGHCQIQPEDFYGGAGEMIVVTNRSLALSAISEIVSQGEGTPEVNYTMTPHDAAAQPAYLPAPIDAGIPVGDGDVLADGWVMYSHFARFKEIRHGRRYQTTQLLRDKPKGSVLPVDWDQVYPMATDPTDPDKVYRNTEVAAVVAQFKKTYTDLIDGLYAAFNGTGTMHDAVIVMWTLKQQALALNKTPSPIEGDEGFTVGPVFEYRHKRSG